MNKEIKFAAFDIDGTILPFGQDGFSNQIKQTFSLLHKKGIKTILITGREFVTIGTLLDQLKEVDYFIGANGAFVYDVKNKKTIHEQPIYYQDFEKFYEEGIKKFPSITVMDANYGHVSENTQTDSWFLKPHKDKLIQLDDKFSKLDRKHLHLITVHSCDDDREEYANNIIQENYLNLEVQSVWERGLFVSVKGVNKSIALKWLMTYESSSLKHLIAFGDGMNDMEMIRDAGIGVAMENSEHALFEHADKIAPSVDQDGVYSLLKSLEII